MCPKSRRSQRVRNLAINNGYEVYVTEENQMEVDSTSFEEVMRISRFESMEEIIPKRAIRVGYNEPSEEKCDSRGNMERYKAPLIAKYFKQREIIDYNEKFLPISCKDPFRIIMPLVAHTI
jgi:hypothetical protein